MEQSTSEFLQSLREEVLHTTDRRTELVLRKLAFVATFFGIGSIQSDWLLKFNWLLFAVPFVALAFDVYISAEHYKVKRIGTFYRIFRYATPPERNWERFVNQHPEPVAVGASLVITLVAIAASTIVLGWESLHPGEELAIGWSIQAVGGWLIAVLVLTGAVFGYYQRLLNRLPKPHLSEEQTHELLAAPQESTAGGLCDELMIALMLNTGITAAELTKLKWSDLQPDGLHIQSHKKRQRGTDRTVPFRNSKDIQDLWAKYEAALPAKPAVNSLVFSDAAKNVRGLARIWSRWADRVLRKYPVVIEGSIRPVTAVELRRTYARRLYEDGMSLADIQRNLACDDIRATLGYIGPIAARREAQKP